MKDSGEKERWEEIARVQVRDYFAWLEGRDWSRKWVKSEDVAGLHSRILSAIAESHQSDSVINEADGIYKDLIRAIDFAEYGWGIIANASGGDWTKASAEWQAAAEKYRDDFHNEIRFLAGVPSHQSKTEQPEPAGAALLSKESKEWATHWRDGKMFVELTTEAGTLLSDSFHDFEDANKVRDAHNAAVASLQRKLEELQAKK